MSAVSLTTVDLDNCHQEPIHIPGFIQPHGALIALDATGVMTQRSRNAPEVLPGLPPLGRPLPFALWSPHGELQTAIERVLREAAGGEDVAPLATELPLQEVLFDVVSHAFAGRILVEFERRAHDDRALALFPLLAHRCMRRLKSLRTIEDILGETVSTVRELTGFDRVMAYRFMHDDSGEVTAEARADSLEPFIGMRFPASDIPVQARRLYVLNTLRLIADVHDPQVALEALPDQSAPLDLSHSLLRSISPIHIEYLKNIGVAASMSLSIVIEGRLWGLIACHHRQAHRVPYTVRMACDLLADFVGTSVQAAVDRIGVMRRATAVDLRTRLVDAILHAEDVLQGMAPVSDALKASMASDAIVLMHQGKFLCHGATTGIARALLEWLAATDIAPTTEVALHELSGLPESLQKALAPMAGLLAVCFDAPRQGWIVFLRLEQVETITWCGPPDKVQRIGPLGSRLTPMGSLAAWEQVVQGLAVPWDACDRILTQQLGDELRRASAIRNAEIEAARTQLLTMLGHDLRDPLHTMAMVGEVLTRKNPDSNMGERIATSAGRMQRLIMQVLDISRLHSGRSLALHQVDCDVAALLHGLVDEARFSYPDVAMQFDAPDMLMALVDVDRLSQVFSNLVSNARHHGALGEPIQVILGGDDTLLTMTVANVAAPIAPELIDLMRDPFKSGPPGPTNARNPGGLGLGLYIASEVTRAHGGTLHYAHDGQRVRFTMEIPRTLAPSTDDGHAAFQTDTHSGPELLQ